MDTKSQYSENDKSNPHESPTTPSFKAQNTVYRIIFGLIIVFQLLIIVPVDLLLLFFGVMATSSGHIPFKGIILLSILSIYPFFVVAAWFIGKPLLRDNELLQRKQLWTAFGLAISPLLLFLSAFKI